MGNAPPTYDHTLEGVAPRALDGVTDRGMRTGPYTGSSPWWDLGPADRPISDAPTPVHDAGPSFAFAAPSSSSPAPAHSPQTPPLRFKMGDRVLAKTTHDGWVPGTIVELYYREPAWPADMDDAPYKIQLDVTGVLLFACHDTADLVVPLNSYRWVPRAAADNLFGLTAPTTTAPRREGFAFSSPNTVLSLDGREQTPGIGHERPIEPAALAFTFTGGTRTSDCNPPPVL